MTGAEFFWLVIAAWAVFFTGVLSYRAGYNKGVGETRAFYEGKR